MTSKPQKRALLTNHARLEQTHALAGLFSAIPRGERQRRIVRYSPPGTREIWTFAEFWSLGADDLTVLLTVLSLVAQPEGKRLTADKATRVLALEGEARQDTLSLATTRRTLTREAGWEWSGKRGRLLIESLERLAHVTLDVERDGIVMSRGQLLARAVRTAHDGPILIAISPYLAQVIDGGRAWARISLEEHRQLTTDTARLLHAWLSSWLRPGHQGKASVTTLLQHVWPDDGQPIPEGTLRRRRHDIRAALREISCLHGWRVGVQDTRGSIRIHRPRDERQRAPHRLRRWQK